MFFSLQQVTQLLLQYKYLILFPIVVVEGPIITIIAGFLASQGYLNVFITYGISVIGDLVGDTFYYAIGYWGRKGFVDRWGKYFGLNGELMERVEKHFRTHAGKTLLFGKTQAIGGMMLAGAGAAKMPYWKFMWFNVIATVPKSLILFLLGFYFGHAFTKINSYLQITSAVSLGLSIIFLIYFFYRPS